MVTESPEYRRNDAPEFRVGMDYVPECGRKNVAGSVVASGFVLGLVGVLAADSVASSPDIISQSLSDEDTRNTARPLIVL